jgi:hypothetical protein
VDQLLKRRFAGFAAVLALAATAAGAGFGSTASFVVRGDSQIGAFRSSMHLADAVRIFGPATSRAAGPRPQRACTARWKSLGLRLVFAGSGCSNRSLFVQGTITGPRWRTARGLAIGDPVARIKALYPDAHAVHRPASTSWVLLRRAHATAPNLVALATHNRVTAIVVSPASTGTD